MIIPTVPVKIWSVTGYDLHAQPVLEAQPDEKICPVRLSYTVERTTVRTDAAASKGHAFESTATVVVLAVSRTKIQKGSRLQILDQTLRVVERHPRFTVSGVLDHYEIHCDAWEL
jgi:hypothetical protein